MAAPTQTANDKRGLAMVSLETTEGVLMHSLGSVLIGMGTGTPNAEVTAPKGSLFINLTDGDLFANTDGVKAWAVVGAQT